MSIKSRQKPSAIHAGKNGARKRKPVARALGLTHEDIARYHREMQQEPRFLLARNAVANSSVHSVAKSRPVVAGARHTFSHHLNVGAATSQNMSGRCWLFAGLNVMRVAAIKSMNLDEKFELSQSYLMFWDKLEKANYFLHNILCTLDEPVGSRLLDWLLTSPIQDGGQWDMFVNLINKYGVVPKSVMPETDSSSNTALMNGIITAKLREFACKLRDASRSSTPAELEQMKDEFMSVIYRMLCIHLGEPPTHFEWQWRDKKQKFHRDGNVTPKQFYKKHVGIDLDDYVCLINCPQKTKRYNTLYTVEFLGNMVGGHPIRYLNVEMDVMKAAAVKQIVAGESVWFGCDVGKMLDRDLGILDMNVYDYELVYGTKPELDKAQRLDYGQSCMTHAMVFSGVDLDASGKPRKWRVENSWGEKIGDKGFLIMTDRWFDEYMYEVVVQKKYVSQKILAVLKTAPVKLHPWDPMGTLARSG